DQELGVNVHHIESRKSRTRDSEFEIYVDIDCDDKNKMSLLLHHLRHEVDGCTMEEYERSKHKKKDDEKRGPNLLLPQPSVDIGV
ncbi:tryptophan 5-hydroxylase 1-like protein, partial [Leptotrombidium deliense]